MQLTFWALGKKGSSGDGPSFQRSSVGALVSHCPVTLMTKESEVAARAVSG